MINAQYLQNSHEGASSNVFRLRGEVGDINMFKYFFKVIYILKLEKGTAGRLLSGIS